MQPHVFSFFFYTTYTLLLLHQLPGRLWGHDANLVHGRKVGNEGHSC